MGEVIGREGFDVVLLAVVQPVRPRRQEDVERLPRVHQSDRVALMVVDRNGGGRHGPVDVGTSGQHADQQEGRGPAGRDPPRRRGG